MAVALSLHTLSAVLWVGGMLFAHVMLRPVAVRLLEPPVRLRLWVGVFQRFFPSVWIAIALLLTTGFWMILRSLGGFAMVALHVHLMTGLGLVMIVIFMYIYFAPYRRMQAGVATEEWSAAAKALTQIRRLVGVNAMLGVVVIVLGVAGRYLSV